METVKKNASVVQEAKKIAVRAYHQGTPQERFWVRVKKGPTCWEWDGSRNKKSGYGFFSIKGRVISAHRFSYELTHGVKLGPRQLVCHTCDNPPCVRPDHLFMGSHRDNAADMCVKERSGQAKLDWLKARAIRELYKRNSSTFNQANLSKIFGVHRSIISDIVLRKTWRALP